MHLPRAYFCDIVKLYPAKNAYLLFYITAIINILMTMLSLLGHFLKNDQARQLTIKLALELYIFNIDL